MGTTACWATNNSFNCAWVSWGYGSRYDLRRSWLSLEGLLILAHYDWNYSPRMGCFALRNDIHEDRVIADKLNLKFNGNSLYYDIPDEFMGKLPLKYQMNSSPIHINHPEGLEKSLEWYTLACERVGKCFRDGYNGVQYYHSWGRVTVDKTPSIEQIKEINLYHYKCFMSIKARRREYDDSTQKPRKEMFHQISDEDLKEILKDWDDDIKKYQEEKDAAWNKMRKFL